MVDRTLGNYAGRLVAIALIAVTLVHGEVRASGEWVDLKIETDEVTRPDIAITPDGSHLIFTLLGHLVRIPVDGGEAEQLTFGASFDARPAVSPDGKRVAFQSDRDGSEGNIFVLELATGEVRQVTHERWADVPVFSPDGSELAFISFEREQWVPWGPVLLGPPTGVVKKVSVDGGDAATLTDAPADVRSPFFLDDGRIGWAVVARAFLTSDATTRIQLMEPGGQTSTLREMDGFVDSIVPVPDGSGLFALRYFRADFLYNYRKEQDIVLIPLAEGEVQPVSPVSGEGAHSHREPRMALAPDGQTLHAGNFGRLWQIKPPAGLRVPIPFHAALIRSVRERIEPPRWEPLEPGTMAQPRSIEDPQLSPDGSVLAFRTVGRVWLQALPDGDAGKVTGDLSFDPAFSVDGHQLAYITGKPTDERDSTLPVDQEIRIFDIETGNTRSLVSGTGCAYEHLSWWDANTLVAQGCDKQAVTIAVANGAIAELVETKDDETSPQLTADRQHLYYIDKGRFPIFDVGHVYRAELGGAGQPQPQAQSQPQPLFPTQTGLPLRVSPDGHWVAVPAWDSPGVVLARLDDNPASPADFQLVDRQASTEFNFAPDSQSLIYTAGGRVWRKSLRDGEPLGASVEIPVNLEIEAPVPVPLLLENVRVLDFGSGQFGKEISLLIEKGRISKIGSVSRRRLPKGTEVVDAGGRFAIPGLIEGHGHSGGCGYEEYTAYGVTTVRNMGGSLVTANAQADQADLGGDPIPRCFASGPIFEGEQGRLVASMFVHPHNEEEARAWIRQWKAQGAAFAKLYWIMPWDLQQAAVDEAHRIGLPIYAHGVTIDETAKALIHGYSGLAHFSRHLNDDVLSLTEKTGAIWDTTLGVTTGLEWTQRSQPERLGCHIGGMFYRGMPDDALRGRWLHMLQSLKEAHERGITLLPGTDFSPPATAFHLELEFYADAGIAPIDVLKSATLNAAMALGAEAELGSLQVGKLADIVLLDADPLVAISNARSVWRTIKGGKVFDPVQLGFDPSNINRPEYCASLNGLPTSKDHP